MKRYTYYCDTHGWADLIADSQPTVCHIGSESILDIFISDENPLLKGSYDLDSNLSLASYKQLRYNEIDGKTETLISAGFIYDSATFSTSVMAQANWSSIKENVSDYTFPLLVSTKDSNEYSLAEANVTAFWTAGRDFVKGYLDSGRALKKSVFDAVDKAAVDAVIDNR